MSQGDSKKGGADDTQRERESRRPNPPVPWFEDDTRFESAGTFMDDEATMLRPPTPLADEQTLQHLVEFEDEIRIGPPHSSSFTVSGEAAGEIDLDATRIEYFEVMDESASETEQSETRPPSLSTSPRRDLRFIELAAERLAQQFDAPDPPAVVSLPRSQAVTILTRASRLRPRNTILLHQAVRQRLERGRKDRETVGMLAELCRRRPEDDSMRSELADLLHGVGDSDSGSEVDLWLARDDSGLTEQARHRHLLRAAVTMGPRAIWTGGNAEAILVGASMPDAPEALILGAARILMSSWQPFPERRQILERAARLKLHDKELQLMALEAAALEGDARDAVRPALEMISDAELAHAASRTLASAASTFRQSDAHTIPRELLVQAARNEDCLPDEAVPALARLLIIVGHATSNEIRLFQRACDLEAEDEEFRRALAACSRADRRQAVDFLFDALKTTEAEASDLKTPQDFYPPPMFRNLSAEEQGRYEVREKLGAGAMGEVLLALDRELDELVVLKLMQQGAAEELHKVKAFRREARTARRLSHPNIARIHDIGEHQGVRTISMEYVAGGDLGNWLRRLPERPTYDKVVSIIRQIARGLAHAHREGILHLDVKPGNVLIDSSGRVKLSDFGIASVMGGRGMEDDEDSQFNSVVAGTPIYMSPEQFDDRETSPASDVYSLGILAYELVSGHPPFTTGALAYHHEFTPPPPLPIDTPELLARAITKCLRKKPSERFGRAEDLLLALDSYDGSRSIRSS